MEYLIIPRTNMEFDHLQLFIKVAATGSFSRAASLAGATQSAVSKRIAELERACRWRLFDRTGRGVVLTEAGRWLLPRAELMATQFNGLADNLASTFSSPQGVVRFALQPSVAWPLIDTLYAKVSASCPAIRLQIMEGPTGDIESWMREGRADLALLNRRVAHDAKDATYLFSTDFHLIAADGDAITRATSVSFRRLRELPLVGAVLPNGGRVLLEEAAQRYGFALRIVVEVNSVYMMKRLVAAGRGFGVASLDSVTAELRAGTLQASRIVAPQLHEHFALVESPRHPSSVAASRVATLVSEICRARAQIRRHAK